MSRVPHRKLPVALYLALFCALIAPSFAPTRLALAAGPACTVGASGANYTAVQAAVNDSSCSTIDVAAGTYRENVTISRSVTLQGTGAASTIIDGHTADSVFIVSSGASVNITGVSAINGSAFNGGGVRNAGTVILSNSEIISNTSFDDFGQPGFSSGIYNAGVLTLNNSTVSDNKGSAIYSSGPLTLNNSTVSGGVGNGIVSVGGLTLNNSSVSDNYGFGISSVGSVMLTNTTISGNQAQGAIFQRTETTPAFVALTNVTISGNSGINIENNADLKVMNSTIANPRYGSSIYANIQNSNVITFTNTIIEGNDFATCSTTYNGSFKSSGHNLDSGNTCGLTSPGDQINTDPKLGPLRDNGGPTRTQALRPNSPAIDVGDTNTCPTTDQRGAARAATCDIGAYEYRAGPALSSISPDSIEANGPAFTLTVNGSGFINGAAVQLNGVDRPTTFVSASKLLAAVSVEDIANPGAIEITATNPGLDGSSPAATLMITPPITDRSGIAYVSSIGGGVPTVAISGTLAYIGEGSQLTILNVNDPAAPVRLGSFTTRANVQDVEVIGNRAYVTVDRDGLLILDVSDSAHPTKLGSIDTPGRAYDVQVVGERAYIADESSGLRIVDVSNPAAPTQLGFFHDGPVYDLSIVGNIAYLATGNYVGLRMLDISDPAHPIELAASYSPSALGVQVVGTIAYVASSDRGLELRDVANPQSYPPAISSIDTIGRVKDLTVVGNRAYVVNYDGTLHIVDVSDPAQPQLLSSYNTPGNSWDVRVVGNRAYVADGVGGLLIVDVSDPQHPAKLGTFATWSAYKIKVAANRAYIAGGITGLQILDVEDPARPAHLGSFTTTGVITNLAIDGNRAFLIREGSWNGSATVGGGVEIVNVTDPSHPTSLGSYPIEYPNQVQVIGTRAYVAAQDGLHILDVGNPGAITQLGLAAGVNYSAVQVIGNRAYLVFDNVSAGLAILDLSNPAVPATIGTVACLSNAFDAAIQVVGNAAYIADRYRLCTINVSDPAHPQSISVHYAFGSAKIADIKVVGTIAYLAESDLNDGYLELIDASEPIPVVPNKLSEHDLSRPFSGVDVVGNLAYTASEQGGLHILHIDQERYPASASITPSGGSLTNHDGSVALTFPSGAVTTPITISYSGLVTPTQSLGGAHSAGHSFLLEARNSAGQPVTQFALPYTLVISYTDEELAALGIAEADLNLAFWNGSAWVNVLPCTGCGVDTINNRLTAVLDHFTEFALLSGNLPTAGDGKIRVYLPLGRR